MLALLAGCYLGGRTGVDTALRAGDVPAAVPGGAVDLGFVGSDDDQSGQLIMSIGTSPLVSRDSASAPRVPILMFGGRYEHALTSAHPNVRWFGRLLLGGNPCTPTREEMEAMAEPKCDDERSRDAGGVSAALGIALTTTAAQREHQIVPGIATVGLALVYTYATDAALGTGDFLGLELSFGAGGDFIGPIAKSED